MEEAVDLGPRPKEGGGGESHIGKLVMDKWGQATRVWGGGQLVGRKTGMYTHLHGCVPDSRPFTDAGLGEAPPTRFRVTPWVRDI